MSTQIHPAAGTDALLATPTMLWMTNPATAVAIALITISAKTVGSAPQAPLLPILRPMASSLVCSAELFSYAL